MDRNAESPCDSLFKTSFLKKNINELLRNCNTKYFVNNMLVTYN